MLLTLALCVAQPAPEMVLQSGHTGPVTAVAWSADGRRVATGSFDRSVIIWDTASGERFRSFSNLGGPVRGVAWWPQALVAVAAGEAVTLWDADAGTKSRELAGHSGGALAVAWHGPTGRVAVGFGEGVALWEAGTGKRLGTFAGAAASGVAWSGDGLRLLAAGEAEVAVWDVGRGVRVSTIASGGPAAWSGDGSRVLTPGGVWDAGTGVAAFALPVKGAAAVAWAGSRLATGAADGRVRFWDAATGEGLFALSGHAAGVRALAFSPDGSRLAVGTGGRDAALWHPESGECERLLTGHTSWCLSLAWDAEGRRLAVGTLDDAALVWDAGRGVKLRTLAGLPGAAPAVGWSPDGKTLAVAAGSGVTLFDAAPGTRLRALAGHQGTVNAVAWSPDGKTLATGSDDRTVMLWRATGERLRPLFGHAGPVYAVAWSPDGTRLLSTSADGTVILWNVATGERRRAWLAHAGGANSVAWHPGGATCATGGADGKVCVWDAQAARRESSFQANGGAVRSVAWSAGGRLAAGAESGAVVVWDGERRLPGPWDAGHGLTTDAVGWSADGETLASASWDGTVRLWDAGAGRERARLVGLNAGADWLAVLPTGEYAGSPGAEGYLRWRLPGAARLAGAEGQRERLYRPDRLAAALGDAPPAPAAPAVAAPPVVAILEPRADAPSLRDGRLFVKIFVALPGGRTPERLWVTVGGVGGARRPPPGWEERGVEVSVPPGRHALVAHAVAGGVEGRSEPRFAERLSPEKTRPTLRALCVGVGDYPDGGAFRPLAKAADDARDFAAALRRYAGEGFRAVEVDVLTDAEARRDGVVARLGRFAREMGPGDVGAVFFAGHGTRDAAGGLYLAARDTDANRLIETGISGGQLRQALAGTPGRVALFLDACHAGALAGGDSVQEGLARELADGRTGLAVFAACRGDEEAQEDRAAGGAFTRALVEGLSGKAAEPDGRVSLWRLKLYVDDRVRELSNHQQRPLACGPDDLLRDFVLAGTKK